MTFVTRVARRWRGADTSSTLPARHLVATVKATTVDGLCAYVQVEFSRTVSAGETSSERIDHIAMDAVESALRVHLGTLRGTELPVAGETLDRVEEGVAAAHAVIGNVFVVASDIEVSHELRRRLDPTGLNPPGQQC